MRRYLLLALVSFLLSGCYPKYGWLGPLSDNQLIGFLFIAVCGLGLFVWLIYEGLIKK
jgi:hypothetical protein